MQKVILSQGRVEVDQVAQHALGVLQIDFVIRSGTRQLSNFWTLALQLSNRGMCVITGAKRKGLHREINPKMRGAGTALPATNKVS